MKYLLIWDIDGTLIQGHGIGRKALNEAFKLLFGISGGFDSIKMAGMIDAVIVESVFAAYGIGASESGRFLERYLGVLKEYIEQLPGSIAAPGIMPLLTQLDSDKDFCNVLGTGNIEKGARIKLSKDRLNRFFPVGGFGDLPLKRWQLIGTAAEKASQYYRYNFAGENTYVIGDTPLDIECGIKLGFKSIGIGTGSYGISRLSESGADFVFQDVTELSEFMNIFL